MNPGSTSCSGEILMMCFPDFSVFAEIPAEMEDVKL